MEPTTGWEASVGMVTALFFFWLAGGLLLLGVVAYFLITLHRIAASLEEIVTLLRAQMRDVSAAPPLAEATAASPAQPVSTLSEGECSDNLPDVTDPRRARQEDIEDE